MIRSVVVEVIIFLLRDDIGWTLTPFPTCVARDPQLDGGPAALVSHAQGLCSSCISISLCPPAVAAAAHTSSSPCAGLRARPEAAAGAACARRGPPPAHPPGVLQPGPPGGAHAGLRPQLLLRDALARFGGKAGARYTIGLHNLMVRPRPAVVNCFFTTVLWMCHSILLNIELKYRSSTWCKYNR